VLRSLTTLRRPVPARFLQRTKVLVTTVLAVAHKMIQKGYWSGSIGQTCELVCKSVCSAHGNSTPRAHRPSLGLAAPAQLSGHHVIGWGCGHNAFNSNNDEHREQVGSVIARRKCQYEVINLSGGRSQLLCSPRARRSALS